jgi:hypothetical protein
MIFNLESELIQRYEYIYKDVGGDNVSLAEFQGRVTLENYQYGEPTINSEHAEVLQSVDYSNDSDLADQQQFAFNKSKQYQHSWSVTKGIQSQSGAKFQVAKFFEANEQVTLSFSTTDAHSETTTVGVSGSSTISIPKRSLVQANLVIYERKAEVPFVGHIKVAGSYTLYFTTYDLAAPRRGHVMSQRVNIGYGFRRTPHPAVEVLDDLTIKYAVEGIYSGVNGQRWEVRKKQLPIGSDPLANGIEEIVISSKEFTRS